MHYAKNNPTAASLPDAFIQPLQVLLQDRCPFVLLQDLQALTESFLLTHREADEDVLLNTYAAHTALSTFLASLHQVQLDNLRNLSK